MKPLKLSFSGLHSYRAKQEVDFTILGSAGLFGIFGPTGAGKSTVLDAITLALYGSVDRAKGGKTGIINQLENTLSVSFSFALGGDVWQVEREYRRKKNDPDGIQVQQARLLKLTGGTQQVVASTASEVDGKITDILGLRRDDFTRAVVLPQGKFDAFLRLTAGDRARMMEYIFALDEYGEVLAGRARNVRDECERELTEIAVEQAALGDASPAAVKRARTAYTEQAQRLNQFKEQVERCKERFDQAEELRKLTEEQNAAKARLAELEAQRPAMEKKRATLTAAQKAEPLRTLLQRENELLPEMTARQGAVQKLQADLAAAEEAVQAAVDELAVVEQRQKDELPALQERAALLAEVAKKAQQLAHLEQKQQEAREEWRQRKKELERAQQEEQKNSQELKELEEQLARISAAQLRLVVEPEERERWQQAEVTLHDLEAREKWAQDREKNYRAGQKQLEEQVAKLQQMVAQRVDGAANLAGPALLQAVQETLTTVEEGLKEVSRQREAALCGGQAASLAGLLKPGEPCPVCGSTHHPHPARQEEYETELERLDAAYQAAEQELRETRSWYDAVRRLALQVEMKQQDLNENLAPAWQAARVEVEECSAELRRLVGDLTLAEVRGRLRALAQQEKERLALEKKRADLEAKRSELTAAARELAGNVSSLEVRLSGIEGEGRARAGQIDALKREISEVCATADPVELLHQVRDQLASLQQATDQARVAERRARTESARLANELASEKSRLEALQAEATRLQAELKAALTSAGFADRSAAQAALLPAAACESLRHELEQFGNELYQAQADVKRLTAALAGRTFDLSAWSAARDELAQAEEACGQAREAAAILQDQLARLEANQQRYAELETKRGKLERRRDLAATLGRLVSGRRFVEFLAEEHLVDMAVEASQRLGALTGQRYALELGERCEFVLRDDFAGGQRRPVTTLSGGETFLTSLALALALSSQLQLKGRYPLGFFFLDEGFGTLDGEKLEVVLQALEKLRQGERLVGVISHVPELRERLPVRLEVLPAGPDGTGSSLRLVRN